MSNDEATNMPPDDESAVLEEPSGRDGFDGGEIELGRQDAVLCYVLNFLCFPYALRPLLSRENGYSLYHAKQAGVVWAGLFSVLLLGLLTLPLFGLGLLVWLVGFTPFGVLNFLGLLQSLNGEAKPLPFLEEYPHHWLKFGKRPEEE